jgi:hypothetical protein
LAALALVGCAAWISVARAQAPKDALTRDDFEAIS